MPFYTASPFTGRHGGLPLRLDVVNAGARLPSLEGGGGLHPRLLLLAGARAAILRVSLVELPREVKGEGATGWVMDCQIAIAVEDGIGLVGIEDVDAAQVGS